MSHSTVSVALPVACVRRANALPGCAPRITSGIVALLVLAGASWVEAAPPVLNYLFPAGATRGTTVEVTAAGTFGAWPVEAWIDREGIQIEAGQKKGTFKFTVAADAPGGVFWLRLVSDEGASALRPFVVGTLPELMETEPNDGPTAATLLAGSCVVNGKLAKSDDVDAFAIALAQGQTLVASLQANELLASPMDGVLQICTPDGFVVAQNDDARGLDPLVVFQAPTDGTYLVRTFAFPATPNSSIHFAGGDNFVYRLTITTGGFVDHAFPLTVAPGDSTSVELYGWNIPAELAQQSVAVPPHADAADVFHADLANTLTLPARRLTNVVAAAASEPANPQPISLPATVTGRIDEVGDVDAFRFSATKGRKLSFQVESRELGFPLDAVLRITDSTGKQLAEADDNKRQADPVLSFTAPADGDYQVEIRDLNGHGGLRYVYRLTAEPLSADFSLSLAADSFVVTPGTPLAIPVTIQRENGFAEEIEVAAEGLPDGVSATPVQSEPKGETAKSVTLMLTAENGPHRGAFQIVGRAGHETKSEKAAHFTVPGTLAGRTDAWLTVLAPTKGDDAAK